MSTYEAVKQAALGAYDAGICIIPPMQDGSKAPDMPQWKRMQTVRPPRSYVEQRYAVARTGVGWVMGPVSAPRGYSLEAFDFDDRSVYILYRQQAEKANLLPVLERVEAGYFEHSPNGAHLLYYTKVVEGNQKLASIKVNSSNGKPGIKAVIETRGRGGYLIVAPTYGSVNASGAYILQSGGIETIATVTAKEREELFNLAKAFDKVPKIERHYSCSKPTTGDRPGDAYNQSVSWDQVLEGSGWRKLYSSYGKTAYCRPGKKVGVSATANYADSDLFYVFSTNAYPFEAERGYDKFGVYTMLHHNGDFAAAASELALLGYGQSGVAAAEGPAVDLSGIYRQMEASKPGARIVEEEPESAFPRELLEVPGLVGHLAQYINDTSPRCQPILALASSIATVGTIIGRKTCTDTDLRSNVYIIGVGETGCGKDHARKAIARTLTHTDARKLAKLREPASDAGIITSLVTSPSILYLIDEFGRYVSTVAGFKGGSPYLTNQIKLLLELYSSANGSVESKARKGGEDQHVIEQPCMSIYGTTVPRRLYDSLETNQVEDGLLSRFLVFESDDPEPDLRRVPFEDPSQELVNEIRAWTTPASNTSLADTNLFPNPKMVKPTSDAIRIFDELNANLKKKRVALRQEGKSAGIYTRTWEAASKLALIRACGIRANQPEITESDARWGCRLALFLVDTFMDRIEDVIGQTDFERAAKRILKIIRATKKTGMSGSKLSVRSRKEVRDGRQRKDIITDLLDGGQIVIGHGESTGGRPPVRFYATEHAPIVKEKK